MAEGGDPAEGSVHRPLRHLDEDPASRQDGPSRLDVLLDPEPAPPDREESADPPDKGLPERRG